MKKQPYSKRPYRFTVGLGAHGHHLRILAGDDRTRAWALSVQARISVVTRTVTDELVGKVLCDGPAPSFVANAVSLETIRARLLELLVAAFPRSRFEVTEPAADELPPVQGVVEMSTPAMHGMLAMLAGQATPEEKPAKQ